MINIKAVIFIACLKLFLILSETLVNAAAQYSTLRAYSYSPHVEHF